jgi:hypothetical protein
MIFKKDNFVFGTVLGFLGPILGIILFKMTKFQTFTFRETLHFMLVEETNHKTLSVALSLSLLVNAVLFTIYINSHKDKTAKGIFTLTCVYGFLILLIKTFN